MNPIATHDSPAPATVADRLRGARRRGFVGRAAELELFRAAVDAPEPPFSILWICGPGGVGKTTLLGALAAGREPAIVDLRAVEPSPPAFAAVVTSFLRRQEQPVELVERAAA
jgi:replication-associated recombination protein RarA